MRSLATARRGARSSRSLASSQASGWGSSTGASSVTTGLWPARTLSLFAQSRGGRSERLSPLSLLTSSTPGIKAEPVDPEEVRAFLSPHHARVRSALEQFGGTVEKLIGETVMAVFGAPAAHEDDPERAVRAALSVRDLLTDQGEGPHARIAVATGEALVTLGASASEREPIAVGQVVKTAARLRHAAPVDVVLVDGPTFRRTSDAIEYREAAPIAVASTSEAISVWEAIRPLAGPGVDLSRHRTPFVGRERELALLHERLEWAASERSPQLVTILGVPGIGKSRLVSQLQEAVARRDERVTWRQGRSLPYGDGVGFWALGEIVKAQAGILESDPPAKVERKLATAVRRVLEDPAEAHRIATHLGLLVGLGGDEATAADRRSATFTAWRQFLEALADERPLVLVFEDLHWADAALLDFVDELLDRVSGVPLLVLATTRPELLERRPDWAGGKPSALTISLPPLSESETRRLVATMLERPVLTSEVHGALLPRIGGNPLYAEQFCRMLAERGRLEALPETLHGIIAARLDGLAHAEKRLLQDAAVLGKVFWLGALEAVGRVSRTDAEALLSALARREFVQRVRRSSVAGDIEYAFVHQLLRDVAYSEITHTDRAECHRWAAEWIDSLGRPEEHAELVAHHYLVALDYTRAAGEDVATLAQRATQALHRAGLRAIRLSANERAVEHFSGAITLVGQLPETDERSRTEAELQLQLGVALVAQRGLGAPEVEQAYIRATELMMGSAPAAEHFPAQVALSIYHGHRGDFGRSMRLVERLTELASQGDDSMRLQALHARWMNCLFGGQIDGAIAAADAGRAIYRPEVHHSLSYLYGNHDPCVCALALQALALALRGDSVRAVNQMHEAIDLGEALGHAATLAQPLTQLPWALQINGDAEATLRDAERALALERDIVHPQFFGVAHAMRGWALARLGNEEEGVAELERALADELQASHIWAAMIGGLLAEVHLRRGRRDLACDLLVRMRTLTASMPAYFFEPELLRVEAEWLQLAGQRSGRKGTPARVDPGRATARVMGLRSSLRACTRASALGRGRGRPEVARRALRAPPSRERHRLRTRGKSAPRSRRRDDSAADGGLARYGVLHGPGDGGFVPPGDYRVDQPVAPSGGEVIVAEPEETQVACVVRQQQVDVRVLAPDRPCLRRVRAQHDRLLGRDRCLRSQGGACLRGMLRGDEVGVHAGGPVPRSSSIFGRSADQPVLASQRDLGAVELV